jgi:hypothetical protein
VVEVVTVGALAGAVVVDDPCISAMEINCPVDPPMIELEVTLPPSVIWKAL